MGIATLAVSSLATLGSAGVAAQADRSAGTLDCVDLAAMHLEYLLLDEVIAGRGPAVYADIDRARDLIEYLLLPEVARDGTCHNIFPGA